MSEILSPAQVDEMVNIGTPLPDMFGHLLVSHRALHAAHDAALERERVLREALDGITPAFQSAWESGAFSAWAIAGVQPQVLINASAALAAARTPDAAVGEGE
jgi:hypothetical protein